ncbi:MAG: hypothetical protein AB7S99_03405 [Pseudodonghicola sp.]
MATVRSLTRVEAVQLDWGRLGLLYRQMGDAGAETVITRASRELAFRLIRCDRLWRIGDIPGLRKCARSTIAIAEQIGMAKLAGVARDVTVAADQGDPVAVAATLARLQRMGRSSLRAVWRMRGLSL